MKRSITIFLFVLLGLPIVVYPFVLLANTMSLAGHKSGNETFLYLLVTYGFIFLTSSYPISYLYGLILARKANFESYHYIFYPLVHVGLIIMFFYQWSIIEN